MRYRPFQPMAKVVSVSSMWIGSLSPSRASLAASRSAGSSNRHRRFWWRTGLAGRRSRYGRADWPLDAEYSAPHRPGETATDNLLAGSAPDRFPTLGGSWGDCHGIVHPAVRRSAGLRLPLL